MKLHREDRDLLKALLEPVALTIAAAKRVTGVGYQPTLRIGDSEWSIESATFNCRCTPPAEEAPDADGQP